MAGVMESTAERRSDLRAMGLLALLITVLYADVLFAGMTFFTRDLTAYHYPMKWVVREIVLGGDFPFWNRLYSAGQPLAANPAYEVFYPPQWLTLLPDYNFGFRLHIVLHVFIAVFGAFRFFRSIELGVPASFAGALIFATCGPYVSTLNLLPFLFSISWVPWIALYARRWILGRGSRDFVSAALFLGVQAVLCEPTTLMQTWGVIALYAAFVGWGRGGLRGAGSNLIRGAALVAMGIAVAAVQFLPAADHAGDSVRAIGFPFSTVARWSFPPARALELAFPNFLGTLEAQGPLFWGGRLYADTGGPFLYSVYLSLVLAGLALAGAFRGVAGRGLLALVAVPSFVLAAGSHTPALAALYGMDLLPSIRYPEKFILSASFAMVTYGVVVLDRVLGGESVVARRTAWICGGIGAAALLVFLGCLHPGYPVWFAEFWGTKGTAASSIARTQWLVAALRGAAFAVVMYLLAANRGRKSLALLILVLLADLAPLGNQINPRIHRSFFDEPPPLAEQLDLDGSRLAHVASMQMKAPERPAYFQGQRAYRVIRNGLWPATPALHGIPTCFELDVDETQLLRTRAVLDVVEKLAERGVFDWIAVLGPMYGSGPVLVYRDPATELRRVGDDWSEIQPVDLEQTPRYPRYYFASRMVEAPDDARLTDLLARQPWDPRSAFVSRGAHAVGAGRVLTAEESANRTELEVEADADAFLVLSSTSHKYWQATIDGVPAGITETNIAFQGVAVPAGKHRVVLTYYNPTIAVGAIITCLSLVALGFVWTRRAGIGGEENRSLDA
ncbi:MAG: YfhO family protein [Thermoanaerobaculia bacterium]|nr:YfhO family protein [Thermoanaerobaculia bacterium]